MKYPSIIFLTLFMFSCQASVEKEERKPEISVQNWADTLDTQNELGLYSSDYSFKEYTEQGEKHAIFFNTHTYKNESGEEFQDSVLASSILFQNEGQIVEWEMRDFIRRKGSEQLPEEYSIAFWDTYMSFDDIDGDGLVEPILVYGTSALNGIDDGRVKILTYYKGRKLAIRHQSGVLDFDRNTQVDSALYELPTQIQTHLINLMEKIAEDKEVIFPAGWREAMKKEKTFFDEN